MFLSITLCICINTLAFSQPEPEEEEEIMAMPNPMEAVTMPDNTSRGSGETSMFPEEGVGGDEPWDNKAGWDSTDMPVDPYGSEGGKITEQEERLIKMQDKMMDRERARMQRGSTSSERSTPRDIPGGGR